MKGLIYKGLIIQQKNGILVYRAAKLFSVPESTLRDRNSLQ
jgi:hypothetical protein